MKKFIGILLFTCANAIAFAQVNFVKNPSFEDTIKCPNEINQISYAKCWSCAVDTVGEPYYAPEYYTAACITSSTRVSVPLSTRFYQYPHTGKGMAGGHLFYDGTPPSPPLGFDRWRDYFQGRFHKALEPGKTYCISFWVNLAEASGYAQDKIGAYIDDGTINDRDTPGNQILDVTPQVYATKVMDDTMYWQKIEGSFVATGNETHITLGNFFPNSAITAISNTWGPSHQYSYYLFDDVSVIPIDLEANAGKDSHAEPGKPVEIGRVGDTTAMGLDCKWHYKGVLIDSGAIISVNGAAIVGTLDTYVVVQTICGLSKSDTVTVTTVPVGMRELGENGSFSVYPNPSRGAFTISAPMFNGTVQAKVYDLLGRSVYKQTLVFNNGRAGITVNTTPGIYILELSNEAGNTTRQRIIIE